MRQRLYEYLLDRPGGATADELIALVFTARGRDPEFGSRFVTTMLGSDPRFRYDAESARWRVRTHDVLMRPLDDVGFIVVDLETTGGGVGQGGITEIGAVRVLGGRIVDRFTTLVNPECAIQPFVVRLTGITDDMVANAPPIAEALPQLLAFAGPDPVLVAHNAGFDVGHLRHAHRVTTGRPLDLPSVCTIRLARRILPDLRRRSLESVAAHLGLGAAGRHRALPDAEMAAEILTVFLERVRTRGVERLDQLLDFQQRAADDQPFVVHVPRATLAALPVTPGVYHLLGADRRVLYVGKAVRLRERVGSYFTNSRGHSRKTLDLVRQVHDVAVTETGSELAASLLEARHIHDLQPPFNRLRRHLPRVAYVKIGVRNAFPRVWTTAALGTDRAVHLGPFPTIDGAERAAAVLAREFGLRTCPGNLTPAPEIAPCVAGQVGTCPAPCAARESVDAYRTRVDAALAFLEGRDATVVDRLEAERAQATEAERFEIASRLQRDLDVLRELRQRSERLAWIVGRQHFVVLVPTIDRTTTQLYAVLAGRLAFETRLVAAVDLVAAVRVIRERFVAASEQPLGRDDIEAATILAAWLRDRRQEGIIIPFEDPAELEGRFDELSVTVTDLRQRGPLPVIDGLA